MNKNKFVLKIDQKNCKGCELCIVYCPQKILKLSDKINNLGYHFCEVKNEEKCNGCGSCYLMCPEYIIEILKE